MAAKNKADRLIDSLLAERDNVVPQPGSDLKRLWRDYVSSKKWYLILGLLITAVLSAQQMGFALTWRFLFDQGLNGGQDIPRNEWGIHFHNVLLYVIMTAGIWIGWLILRCSRDGLVLRVGRFLVYTLRKQLHEKLQRLHINYFERTPTGRILSRVMDDVNVILTWAVQHSIMLLHASGTILLNLGLLFYLNARIASAVTVSLPFYFILFLYMRKRIDAANKARRSVVAKQYGYASERINGIQILKTFNAERKEASRFGTLTLQDARIGIRLEQYNQLLPLMAGILTAGMMALVIFLSARNIRTGLMTIGDFAAFMQCMSSSFMAIERISMLIVRSQETMVVIRRVFSILDEPQEMKSGRTHISRIKGGIDFDDVTFTYPGQHSPALTHVSFSINAGEKIALMGPSGSGKSTILWLLLRFYDPESGIIKIDDSDIRDLDISSLRRHVCMVQQEPTIFSGTVKENIAYGNLSTNDESIKDAARNAEIHDFVDQLQHGYTTTIGENGVTLSGGQKQRVALAASLLTQPEVLLLDDTTSALDAQTEARIQQTLNTVLQDRTSIIITHRIATSAKCSKIIVIENGHITQQGTHTQLKVQEGFYRRILQQQNRQKQDM